MLDPLEVVDERLRTKITLERWEEYLRATMWTWDSGDTPDVSFVVDETGEDPDHIALDALGVPRRALTVREPWVQAILQGKFIENRSRKPFSNQLGKTIALHTSKTVAEDAWNTVIYEDGNPGIPAPAGFRVNTTLAKPGCIVGVFRLVGWVEGDESWLVTGEHRFTEDCDLHHDSRGYSHLNLTDVGREVVVKGSDWWQGPVGWLLDEARRIEHPVEARGNVGFWRIPLEQRKTMILKGK